MTACSSCKQRIVWARTTSGKAIPLNPEPLIGGNLELTDGVVRYVQPSGNVALYTAHFSNCPSADAHRKGRRKS